MLVSLNQAACKLFGLEEKELLNKNFFELIINEKNQRIQNPFKLNEPLFLRDFSLINYKKDIKIPVEISLAKINDSSNPFVVGVLRDVSYQRENERLRDDFIATLTHLILTICKPHIRERTIFYRGHSPFISIICGSYVYVNSQQKAKICPKRSSAALAFFRTNLM